MSRPTLIFRPGQIVRLPFPYVEREAAKRRPGLVMASFPDRGFLWVAMVTSAANAPWPEDVAIADLDRAGLRKPSVIRPAKLTMVACDVADVIGEVAATELAAVRAHIRSLLV
jgi:mRNA interferase MazF